MPTSMDVFNTQGKKVGQVELPETVFGVKPNPVLVHEVVTAYLANVRRGTHSTKTRGEVSGGGLKPWKQKHTGRARSGSTRSPLWRHGGVTFGPKPRSYVQSLPTAKRKLALKVVLTDFAKNGKLLLLDAFGVSEPKTKRVAEILKTLACPAKTLLVVDKANDILSRAAGNVSGFDICLSKDLNCYEALSSSRLVMTQPALEQIVERLSSQRAEKAAA